MNLKAVLLPIALIIPLQLMASKPIRFAQVKRMFKAHKSKLLGYQEGQKYQKISNSSFQTTTEENCPYIKTELFQIIKVTENSSHIYVYKATKNEIDDSLSEICFKEAPFEEGALLKEVQQLQSGKLNYFEYVYETAAKDIDGRFSKVSNHIIKYISGDVEKTIDMRIPLVFGVVETINTKTKDTQTYSVFTDVVDEELKSELERLEIKIELPEQAIGNQNVRFGKSELTIFDLAK
ncbi:MAG: hypothetical protein HOE90_21735 [Bacteriovoracaceae bacterium]|nr:hypothetical protein [Bacteriovoracaceae bacterium]